MDYIFLKIIVFQVVSLVGVAAFENRPCMLLGTTDMMTIPNQYIKDLRISPFIDKDNFVRLNVTLQSFEEFEHLTGFIRVFSKDKGVTCHRYRKNYFKLKEKQFLVPRYDYPAEDEEIKTLCNYIIDLDVMDECILFSDSFRVIDILEETESDSKKGTPCTLSVRITSAVLLDNQTLRVNWKTESNTTNMTHIKYFVRAVNTSDITLDKLQELNNATHYISDNFSIIYLKNLHNSTDYELIGKFNISTDCYHISTLQFSFADYEGETGSSEILDEVSNYTIHIFYFLLLAISVIIIVALIVNRNRSSPLRRSTSIDISNPSISNNIHSNKEEPSYIIITNTECKDFEEFEVSQRNVTFGKRIGGGAFGDVFCGDLHGPKSTEYSTKKVAIKIPKDTSPYKIDSILEEIKTMQKIGYHPNIVKLLGCCTTEHPYMIIMELVDEGKSLKEYLNELRRRWEITKVNSYPEYKKMKSGLSGGTVWHIQKHQARASPKKEIYCEMKNVLDSKELQTFAMQIASGMEHLEALKIVHRDLAARNILMTEDKRLKISDFGMSKTEAYFSYKPYKQPARWMAIESLKYKFFNTKTDVWSFGVVLWELGTLGALPYKEVEDNLLTFYLSQGARLGKPQICTSEMYSVMQMCWLENPELRPTFKELLEELDMEANKIYVITNTADITPPSMLFRGDGS